jgi:uncharacterized protein YjbI with pentapeptide repeats
VLCVAGGISGAVLLIGVALWGGAIWSGTRGIWRWYRGAKSPSEAIAPIFTLAAGLAVAWIAWMRHFAQTEADRQRRIIESFSKAIEQLGSEKLEVRLGGIYALERISQESPKDYWTVMENLTAFIREQTRPEAERLRKPLDQRLVECAYSLWENAGRPEGRSKEFWAKAEATEEEKLRDQPATDIAAVVTVIKRRSEDDRVCEAQDKRVLDFRQAVLRNADFSEAHLEGADLRGAHLEGANFYRAHFEGADLREAHLEGAASLGAHLEGADLRDAHLTGADFLYAHLEGAALQGAHLEGAALREAHLKSAALQGAYLEGAALQGAHLEGANLRGAHLGRARLGGAHLEGANLREAHLEGVDLNQAHLGGTHFRGARLEGANLHGVIRMTQAQIDNAYGDANTGLPEGLTRPAHWLEPKGSAPAA